MEKLRVERRKICGMMSPQRMHLKISIVIPAFNEERLLAQSLEAVSTACSAFARRYWQHEIIVCDNNSTDRTAEIASAAGAKVVFEPINQISRARNQGAREAQGEWLLFIDADSFPSPALFEELSDAIASDRFVGGGALVTLETSSLPARLFTGLWNTISRIGTLPAGSFIFVRRDAFESLNGFSESLYAGEELEFAERLKTLARGEKRRLVILRKHPLKTSARKVELYSFSELAWFFTRALFAQQRVLQDRDACHPWYDGRR